MSTIRLPKNHEMVGYDTKEYMKHRKSPEKTFDLDKSVRSAVRATAKLIKEDTDADTFEPTWMVVFHVLDPLSLHNLHRVYGVYNTKKAADDTIAKLNKTDSVPHGAFAVVEQVGHWYPPAISFSLAEEWTTKDKVIDDVLRGAVLKNEAETTYSKERKMDIVARQKKEQELSKIIGSGI